jgi:hypothetical protein
VREAALRIAMEADLNSKTDWTGMFEGLRKEIGDKIEEGFGPTQAELYLTVGNLVRRPLIRVANSKHQTQLEISIRDLDYLDDFIRRFEPSPNFRD